MATTKLTEAEQKNFLEKNREPGSWRETLREVLSSTWLVSILAGVFALVIGGVLIIASNINVQEAAGSLFSDPGRFLGVCWETIANAYVALFSGAVVNFGAADFTSFIKPITETLSRATPLTFTGLALAVSFKTSLFNIGGQGQFIMGAVLSAFIGFTFNWPPALLIPACVLAAFVGGAIWGFIPGILKAKTSANEVIVTIMLNYVALHFISWILLNPVFQKEGQSVPIAKPMHENAVFPRIFGDGFATNFSFILALVAVAAVWWLLNRSYLGFEMRAVGLNPNAAKNAGMKVNTIYLLALIISGGLCGLGATSQVLVGGTGLNIGTASTYGFDAITVALLGRSNPVGTLLAAILFGGLKAGGFIMQARTGTPIDVVQIIQALVVMFIAAPPLVRKIFHLPAPNGKSILDEVA
jgi:simple sugar transport system permease protein